MRRLLLFLTLALAGITLSSCVDDEEFANTNYGNFEALWTVMDEHYCFFDYKAETLGVSWNEVFSRYKNQVVGADTEQLFEVLANMLGELQDGHVNLSSGFDLARNWSWKEDYPSNFSDTLYNKYIGTDYRIATGIRYCILDDNVGYMRVETFEDELGEGNLDNILYYFLACRALIVDLRSNSGGMITESHKLAARFINDDTLVGYRQHKSGTGHSDFSDPEEIILEPSSRLRWQKPVFVLTNRAVYSAANEFVMCMQQAPQCTIVGDTTGGGAGMPFSNELPNGWGVRFSACPTYNAAMVCIEHGISPDVECALTDEDFAKGLDTIIETARALVE